MKAEFTPSDFRFNEAWILLKINDIESQEGRFNFFALMEAASCRPISNTLSGGKTSMSPEDAETILMKGYQLAGKWPEKIIISYPIMDDDIFESIAVGHGIYVEYIPERNLLKIIKPLRDATCRALISCGAKK